MNLPAHIEIRPAETEKHLDHREEEKPFLLKPKTHLIDPAKGDKVFFSVISYLGPLVIIPLIVGEEDPFVQFHMKQGLLLFFIEAIIWFLRFEFRLSTLYNVVHFLILVFAFVGIINVVQEKRKGLPLIGPFSRLLPKKL